MIACARTGLFAALVLALALALAPAPPAHAQGGGTYTVALVGEGYVESINASFTGPSGGALDGSTLELTLVFADDALLEMFGDSGVGLRASVGLRGTHTTSVTPPFGGSASLLDAQGNVIASGAQNSAGAGNGLFSYGFEFSSSQTCLKVFGLRLSVTLPDIVGSDLVDAATLNLYPDFDDLLAIRQRTPLVAAAELDLGPSGPVEQIDVAGAVTSDSTPLDGRAANIALAFQDGQFLVFDGDPGAYVDLSLRLEGTHPVSVIPPSGGSLRIYDRQGALLVELNSNGGGAGPGSFGYSFRYTPSTLPVEIGSLEGTVTLPTVPGETLLPQAGLYARPNSFGSTSVLSVGGGVANVQASWGDVKSRFVR